MTIILNPINHNIILNQYLRHWNWLSFRLGHLSRELVSLSNNAKMIFGRFIYKMLKNRAQIPTTGIL